MIKLATSRCRTAAVAFALTAAMLSTGCALGTADSIDTADHDGPGTYAAEQIAETDADAERVTRMDALDLEPEQPEELAMIAQEYIPGETIPERGSSDDAHDEKFAEESAFDDTIRPDLANQHPFVVPGEEVRSDDVADDVVGR